MSTEHLGFEGHALSSCGSVALEVYSQVRGVCVLPLPATRGLWRVSKRKGVVKGGGTACYSEGSSGAERAERGWGGRGMGGGGVVYLVTRISPSSDLSPIKWGVLCLWIFFSFSFLSFLSFLYMFIGDTMNSFSRFD